jgi:hypothetical protein
VRNKIEKKQIEVELPEELLNKCIELDKVNIFK